MAKFREGERARYVPVGRTSPMASTYSGQEVVVLDVGPLLGGFDYRVAASDGETLVVAEASLRKLTGSWDEIERLTHWRPGKSKQREPEAVS